MLYTNCGKGQAMSPTYCRSYVEFLGCAPYISVLLTVAASWLYVSRTVGPHAASPTWLVSQYCCCQGQQCACTGPATLQLWTAGCVFCCILLQVRNIRDKRRKSGRLTGS